MPTLKARVCFGADAVKRVRPSIHVRELAHGSIICGMIARIWVGSLWRPGRPAAAHYLLSLWRRERHLLQAWRCGQPATNGRLIRSLAKMPWRAGGLWVLATGGGPRWRTGPGKLGAAGGGGGWTVEWRLHAESSACSRHVNSRG